MRILRAQTPFLLWSKLTLQLHLYILSTAGACLSPLRWFDNPDNMSSALNTAGWIFLPQFLGQRHHSEFGIFMFSQEHHSTGLQWQFCLQPGEVERQLEVALAANANVTSTLCGLLLFTVRARNKQQGVWWRQLFYDTAVHCKDC